jgi:hypothetical protein
LRFNKGKDVMAKDPLRRTPPRPAPPTDDRPKIWVEGDQRPPLTLRGLRRATLHLARDAVAPLHAWAARATRRLAVNVAGGTGRIPEGKLGRFDRFVPSHLRVAGWLRNTAAVMAHASAVADIDVKRGNALVAEIEPHLWPSGDDPAPPVAPPAVVEPEASPFGADAPPVVLEEPLPPDEDPLAAIRDDLEGTSRPGAGQSSPALGEAQPPGPPGPVMTTAIQMIGYLVGWATVIIALPFGLIRALWLWLVRKVDLRRVGLDD